MNSVVENVKESQLIEINKALDILDKAGIDIRLDISGNIVFSNADDTYIIIRLSKMLADREIECKHEDMGIW